MASDARGSKKDERVSAFPEHREKLGAWLNERGLLGEMAEIGCAHGGFARIMLADWAGKTYRMIDPWTAQDASVYKERQEEAWKYQRWFEECSELAERDKRVVVMRHYSHDAAALVPDGSLDCCYIDGNHSLEAVSQDLADWWPKVKSGGLFGGHDFYDATHDGHRCQVQTAVTQWAKANGQFVALTPCSSWWVLT